MRQALWIVMAGLALGVGAASAQDREIVANEGTIGGKWMLAEGAALPTPVYPAAQARGGDNVCLALGYRIETDGSTSSFRVLQQWSSAGSQQTDPAYWEAFARAAADAVAQWRFQPRPDAGTPVPTVTVATLTFTADPAAASAEVGGNCRIANLSDRLAQLGIKRFTDRAITEHSEFHRRQRVGEVMQADAATHRQRRR